MRSTPYWAEVIFVGGASQYCFVADMSFVIRIVSTCTQISEIKQFEVSSQNCPTGHCILPHAPRLRQKEPALKATPALLATIILW